jgi:hypothetical protein
MVSEGGCQSWNTGTSMRSSQGLLTGAGGASQHQRSEELHGDGLCVCMDEGGLRLQRPRLI